MGRLFKSFLFKISKDLTFRITLIIGIALALFMTLIYLLIDFASGAFNGESEHFLTGPMMLMNSFSPVQNFGLAVPINLISFICLEFSQGTIRNKIIAGHSKFKIYTSLFLSGLVFTFALMIVYISICTLLGTLVGGFDLSKAVISGLLSSTNIDGIFILQTIVIAIFVYITIVSFTVFFATLFRVIGPCIPIVLIVLLFLYFAGTMVVILQEAFDSDVPVQVMKILNPLFALSNGGDTEVILVDGNPTGVRSYYAVDTFVSALVNNTVYTALFFVGGALIFKKRDVK